MLDLIKDEQGMSPGLAGGLGVTRAELNVAEVIEGVGLVEAVRDFIRALSRPGTINMPLGIILATDIPSAGASWPYPRSWSCDRKKEVNDMPDRTS